MLVTVIANRRAVLNDELSEVLFCLFVPIQVGVNVFDSLVKFHLTSEQCLVRALDVGRIEGVGLFLHHPVEIFDPKHLGVDVGLDVVAEAVDVVPELVDSSR